MSGAIRSIGTDQNAWWKPVVVYADPPEVGETIFIYCDIGEEHYEDGYGYLVEVLSVERNWNDTCWIISHPGP